MLKFFVVLGKNYTLFIRGWVQTLFIICLPLLLTSVLIFLRNESSRTEVVEPTRWAAFPMGSLPISKDRPRWTVAYTPNTSLCNQVMYQIPTMIQTDIVGFQSEEDLLQFLSNDVSHENRALGAVVFDTPSRLQNMSYTIRLRNTEEWSTRLLFPRFSEGKPRSADDLYASPPAYYRSGFLSIQSALNRAVANLFCGVEQLPIKVDMHLKRMPYPPYLDDAFITVIQRQLSFVIVLGFMFPVLHAIRLVLVEKHERIKESMKMLGMSNSTYWSAWLMAYMTLFVVLNAALTGLLCFGFSGNGPVLGSSNPFVIFLLLTLYAFCLLAFGFAVSTFFDSPHTGTAISCAILIVIFLPYQLLDEHYSELNLAAKLLSSLSPSVAMGFVCMLIGQFEGTGMGVQMSSIFTPPNPGDGLALHQFWFIFLIEGKLLMLFTLYMDAVWPGKYGVPKPWHFPFTTLCRRKRKNATASILPSEEKHSSTDDTTATTENVIDTFEAHALSAVGVETSVHATPDPDINVTANFETEPIGLPVGIALQHVRKVYQTKQSKHVAVSDLTMNVYQGQITVLLGHNGAGKTTTLSILTGLFPPTSGTAKVGGHDIRSDIEGVRTALGFCPQQDIFFSDLTVEEHLTLVARLKGFKGNAVKQQVDNVLNQIHLQNKRNCFAGTLSGGMQRRMSIGMALIGDSKVIILDEPTSGLDPEARRQVWAILQAERATRTILVTTHYMDEADHLGDRIAILSAGKLRCCGSPLFLKANYGAGHLLTIMKQSDISSDVILARVHHHVSGVEVRSDLGDELKLLLPLDAVGQFAALFTELEARKSQLGIHGFGVSVTTMEEVFFRVSEQGLQEPGTASNTPSSRSRAASECGDTASAYGGQSVPFGLFSDSELHDLRQRGLLLYTSQLIALLNKRWIYMRRHCLLTLSQVLIPFVLSLIALLLFRHITTVMQSDDPGLALTLQSYETSQVAQVSYANEANGTMGLPEESAIPNGLSEAYLHAYLSQFDGDGDMNRRRMEEPADYETNLISQVAKPNLFDYRAQYVMGLVIQPSASAISLRGYFQSEALHTAPVALNAMSNGLLRLLANQSILQPSKCPGIQPNSMAPQIRVSNRPLPRTAAERARRLNTTDGLITSVIAVVPLVSNLLLALSYLAGSFSVSLIHEYTSKAKHLQFVSGVKLVPYWLSNYLWDMLVFFTVGSAILASFAMLNLEAFATSTRLPFVALLFLGFGWAVLPQMYLLARLFKSPTSGLVWLTVYNDFTAVIGLLLVALLTYPVVHRQSIAYALERVWIVLSPSFGLADGLLVLFENFQFHRLCSAVPDLETLCVWAPTIPCCLKTCDPFCAYWTPNDLSFERGGIGLNLCVLLVQGFVFNTLVLFLDSLMARRWYLFFRAVYDRFHRCCPQCDDKCRRRQNRYSHFSTIDEVMDQGGDFHSEDQDVRQHRHVIESMPLNRLKEQTSLALRRVSKSYRRNRTRLQRPAVDRISLAVLPSECFGLLGVNGAGKTTMFRMLTGDLDTSEGQIFVNGFDLATDLREAQQSMGYCPQFDALLPYLTGRETLQLYARLRGIREELLNVEVDQLLHSLQLNHYANVQVGHYSGGKRRKLSVAVALVGGTPLVCLDEPTTGVDPVSRRRIWNLLLRSRRQGRTIILSSHSMEECEAICSRVSIVVNGRLKCLGTCQHLKARFGRGYSLTVQVAASPEIPTGSDGGELDELVRPESASLACSLAEEVIQQRQLVLNDAVKRVTTFIAQYYPEARVVNRHQGVIQFHIPTTLIRPTAAPSFNLSSLFHLVEANRANLGLINYSVSQTSLEQIFIDLAKLQEEPVTDAWGLELRPDANAHCCSSCSWFTRTWCCNCSCRKGSRSMLVDAELFDSVEADQLVP